MRLLGPQIAHTLTAVRRAPGSVFFAAVFPVGLYALFGALLGDDTAGAAAGVQPRR